MGAQALSDYARASYGAEMGVEQASEWKGRLVNDVYPEIGQYLDDWLGRAVQEATGVSEVQVIDDLLVATEADGFSANARKWILPTAYRILLHRTKVNGGSYAPSLVESVYRAFDGLCDWAADNERPTEAMRRALSLGPKGPDSRSCVRHPDRVGRLGPLGAFLPDVHHQLGHRSPPSGGFCRFSHRMALKHSTCRRHLPRPMEAISPNCGAGYGA